MVAQFRPVAIERKAARPKRNSDTDFAMAQRLSQVFPSSRLAAVSPALLVQNRLLAREEQGISRSENELREVDQKYDSRIHQRPIGQSGSPRAVPASASGNCCTPVPVSSVATAIAFRGCMIHALAGLPMFAFANADSMALTSAMIAAGVLPDEARVSLGSRAARTPAGAIADAGASLRKCSSSVGAAARGTHDCESDGGADRVCEEPRSAGAQRMGLRRRRL